jgi:hypothetical protein
MEPEQIHEKDLLCIPELGSRNGNQYTATPIRCSEMKSADRRTDAHYGVNLIWGQQKNISHLFLPLSQNEVPSSRRIHVYLYALLLRAFPFEYYTILSAGTNKTCSVLLLTHDARVSKTGTHSPSPS